MINLLPEKNKSIIVKEKNYRTLLFLFVYLLIFLISFSGTLYALSVFSANLAKIEKEKLLEKETDFPDIREREEKVERVNKALSPIASFYQETPQVHVTLEKIYNSFPEQAHLTSFRFTENDIVILTGYAVDWEDLEKIENSLDEHFSNVEFSPGVWAQIKDINFTVTFDL